MPCAHDQPPGNEPPGEGASAFPAQGDGSHASQAESQAPGPASAEKFAKSEVLWSKGSTLYSIFYGTVFYKRKSQTLLARWTLLNNAALLWSGATASTSGLAAWFVWKSDPGKIIWSLLALIAAGLMGLRKYLNVPENLSTEKHVHDQFVKLDHQIAALIRLILLGMSETEARRTIAQYNQDYAEAPVSQPFPFFSDPKLESRIAEEAKQELERRQYVY